MSSIATRAGRAPARLWSPPPTWPLRPSARKRTGRSSAPPAPTGSSASSRRSAEGAGATTVSADIIPHTAATGAIYTAEFNDLTCEFKTDIATYLHTYAPGYPVGYSKNLAGLIAFNVDHPQLEGPWNNALWVGSQ